MDEILLNDAIIEKVKREATESAKKLWEKLEKGSYKSANNRAFYAMEKGIKALLAMEQIEVTTHNGGLK